MATKPGKIPIAPLKWADETEHRQKLALAVNNLIDGKGNFATQLTLKIESLSTVLTDDRIRPTTSVALTPLTPSAQAMVGSGMSVTPGVGSATLYHRMTAIPDVTYGVTLLG